jgi:hypothetical protein
MLTRLQYLNQEKIKAQRANRFESVTLIDSAIQEEQERLQRESDAMVAPLLQQQQKLLSQIRDAENTQALSEFQKGKRDSGARIQRVTEDDPMSDTEITKRISAAFAQFRKWLDDSGIKVTLDAHKRFAQYIKKNESYDIRELSVWQDAFQRAIDIGLFKEGEVTQDEPEPEPEPEKDITELDNKSVKERLIADAEREFAQSISPIWDSFYNSVAAAGHYLTEPEQTTILKAVRERGKAVRNIDPFVNALRKFYPQYLTAEWRAQIESDYELEHGKADDWAKKLGLRSHTYGAALIA